MVGCETSRGKGDSTHGVGFKSPAVYTDTFQYLLDFDDEARVENWSRQLDVTKVTRALSHTLTTRLTFKIPINSTQPRIHESSILGFMSGLVHDFRMFDLRNGVRFDLFGREDTKLYLFHLTERSSRIGELVSQHGDKRLEKQEQTAKIMARKRGLVVETGRRVVYVKSRCSKLVVRCKIRGSFGDFES